MSAALRTALFCSISAAATTSFRPPLLRNLSLSLPLLPLTPHHCRLSEAAGPPPPMANTPPLDASATAASRDVDSAGGEESLLYVSSSMDRQFEGFRAQMEESGNIRERIRAVAAEMEAALRVMHSYLLLVHQSLPVPEVLKKAKAQIEVLKDLYGRLAEILRGCPGQYYRYHGDWRSETQSAVSLLTFSRWLESGCLMTHSEVENELGYLSAVNDSEFGLDIEDYLTGLCFMSNELPRYVVNQVTAGDYDCPRKVLKFLTELHSAFRMLNLRNDFLRKKFDGMKYDLRRVEEVYYDVKIRGLSQSESTQEQNV